MGRMYTTGFEGVTVSAQQDLIALTCAANKVVVIHRAEFTQEDAETAEQLTVELHRISADGSGGTAVAAANVAKHDPGDAASSASARVNDTTPGAEVANTTVWRSGQDDRMGFLFHPTPEERPVIAGGAKAAFALMTTPSTGRKMSGTVTFEEIG
ncbi:MAG TPA: hypothetical protein VFN76_10085 [Candidatus Limnocylindria bacterium]|nr:hypothetical protein [Candidatus Limnocylindria bacterium]